MHKQHISHLKLSNPDSKEWIFQSNEEHQKKLLVSKFRKKFECINCIF